MRPIAATALLAGAAIAYPQRFDWAAIEDPSLGPVPCADVPIVDAAAQQTTLTFVPSSAAAAILSAVEASPTDTSPENKKRDDSGCNPAPASTDTPANFASNTAYQNAALEAVTPAGYQLAYQNATGSSQGVYGYMGYSVLSSYDVQGCSASCDATVGCQSFNIYYERDPSTEPTDTCTDPASTVVIKCVYYGGPVTQASATNYGQYRDDFQVLISGSNGYVNHSIATPSGYSGAVALGNSAINAPLDCNGADTYMGVKIFTNGPFDAGLCAAACSATSDYDRAHPPADGVPQTCQFFNTYVLYNDSAAVGQYCAMYNETWPASVATNNGQYRGSDYFSIGYSYVFSNSTANADEPVGCSNPSSA